MNEGFIAKAADFAIKAHADQKDKIGMLYIYHPAHVAIDTYIFCKLSSEKLKEYDIEPYEILIVSWLHDVPEDTDKTLEDIEKYVLEGMDSFRKNRILDAIDLMTNKGLPYPEFIDKIFDSGNILAIIGKGLDMQSNRNRSRRGLSESECTKLDKKYDEQIERFMPYIEVNL